MKKIFSILFALVLVVSLTWVACGQEGPTVQLWLDDYGEVTFSQLCWMASPEEALYPHSNVGAVEFTFLEGAGEWLLDEHGGGWLNVVIDTTADGGAYQWAVQNLYLTYQDLDYLLGSTPSVQFSLGLDGETPIESLETAVFLSSEPLEEQPEAEALIDYPVSLKPYLAGGSAISDIPSNIGPWIGPLSLPDRTASIRIPAANISAIAEGHMGCAPGAAARSISYLGKVHGFNTSAPQDIYDDLVERMKTDIGGNGTTESDWLAGKNSYCADNNLPISSEIISGGSSARMQQVKDALDAGGAVSISLNWSGGGGHYAMVTSVTDHENGSATITCVDDNQEEEGAQNEEFVIATTDESGNFDDGSIAGSVNGFMIERYTG